MTQVVTQTFPEIQVVVDAPLQMRREVERLRQAAGQTGSDGLEPLLAALGQVLPAGSTLNELDFQSGALRLKDVQLTPEQAAQLPSQLRVLQVQARREGADWLLTSAAGSGSAP